MLIEDEAGDTIGIVRFDPPEPTLVDNAIGSQSDACVWRGQAADLPRAEIYSVTASDGQAFTTMSFAELERANWTAEI